MKTFFVLCIAAFDSILGIRWDSDNNPKYWDRSFEYRLSKFSTKAEVEKKPWSDTYWPSYKGGIANRWQDTGNGAPGFNYQLFKRAELESGVVDINKLSPAEKYDILKGRYDYPLVKSEWRRVSPNDAKWEGLCHGWAAAAINYYEPNPVTRTNRHGIKIPFGSSDVKALLTYFLGEFAQGYEDTNFIGNRCNYDLKAEPNYANATECADINAGAFHVLFGNLVGKRYDSFVVDITRDAEVWNQPVSGYQYSLQGPPRKPSATSAPRTATTQRISFTMSYVDETKPSVDPVPPKISTKKYTYELDLDGKGRILGGSYPNSRSNRVDFMWSSNAPTFFGYFRNLGDLYRAAIPANLQQDETLMAPHEISVNDLETEVVTDSVFKFSPNQDDAFRAWQIPCRSNDEPLKLKFNSLKTRRYVQMVRIYESQDGEIQAPVAFVHGTNAPQDEIELSPGVDALVVFSHAQMAARRVPEEQQTLDDDFGFEIQIR